MNMLFQTILSMSVSGALLVLGVLLINRIVKIRCSQKWQYYIWLLVIVRFLFPFGPEASLMGRLSLAVPQAVSGNVTFSGYGESVAPKPESQEDLYSDIGREGETTDFPAQEKSAAVGVAQEKSAAVDVTQEKSAAVDVTQAGKNDDAIRSGIDFLRNNIGLIWFVIALGMLIRKIVKYQSFIQHVKAGAVPVLDDSLLNRLSEAQWRAGVGKTVELFVNPLVSLPMLVGFWRPCIVMPDTHISEKEFCYIVTHELMHEKRRDIIYKWLVQFTVCLHWFNPLVYVMSHEISKACELSCDEAVLEKMGYEHAADYGKTLLDAMMAAGKYREPLTAVSLSANKQILKERLSAIMNDREKTHKMKIVTAGLTVCMALGMFFVGAYPTGAVEASEASESDAAYFYEAGNLPLFGMAFGELDEEAQETWLNRIYADKEVAFFSVSVEQLNADDPLMQSFAGKAYEDGAVSFFSVLADEMNEELLKKWQDRAVADEKWSFQSVIFEKLDEEEELDDLEKALEEKQLEEYRAAGVTKKGKNYYYKEQLVNVFLDIRKPDESFYTLNMNPAGTVNVKILRAEDGKIIGAAYMTEAEVKELFGDMNREDLQEEETGDKNVEAFPQTMVVKQHVCNVREGAGVEFKVVGLVAEGEKLTVLGSERGSNGQLWYCIDRESLKEKPDASVEACYIRADLLWKEVD